MAITRPGGPRLAPSAGRAVGRTPVLLLVALLVAAGCATPSGIDVPASLPNVTREGSLTLRWALLRQDGVARAAGVAESSSSGQWDATVDLVGVDDADRIVSRGSTAVRPGFAPRPIPFEATLVETGRETGFRLVARVQQYSRPGR
jgi:hypothetical protein